MRPVLSQIPAMSLTEPLGLSVYLSAIWLFVSSCWRVWSSVMNRPSPCAMGSVMSVRFFVHIHGEAGLTASGDQRSRKRGFELSVRVACCCG